MARRNRAEVVAWSGSLSGRMARKWLRPNCRDSVTTISRSGKTSASWIMRRRFFSANPCPNSRASWVARVARPAPVLSPPRLKNLASNPVTDLPVKKHQGRVDRSATPARVDWIRPLSSLNNFVGAAPLRARDAGSVSCFACFLAMPKGECISCPSPADSGTRPPAAYFREAERSKGAAHFSKVPIRECPLLAYIERIGSPQCVRDEGARFPGAKPKSGPFLSSPCPRPQYTHSEIPLPGGVRRARVRHDTCIARTAARDPSRRRSRGRRPGPEHFADPVLTRRTDAYFPTSTESVQAEPTRPLGQVAGC